MEEGVEGEGFRKRLGERSLSRHDGRPERPAANTSQAEQEPIRNRHGTGQINGIKIARRNHETHWLNKITRNTNVKVKKKTFAYKFLKH